MCHNPHTAVGLRLYTIFMSKSMPLKLFKAKGVMLFIDTDDSKKKPVCRPQANQAHPRSSRANWQRVNKLNLHLLAQVLA